MKVAVIGCFYGNADILPEVLRPWIALKREGYSIGLLGINAQFKEYAELGYTNDDEATRAALSEHRTHFEHLVIEKTPLMEYEVRNRLLEYAKAQQYEAIWLLDGDEMYTEEEIKRILTYVDRMQLFDLYHIHFQNFILDTMRSRDGFLPPRIIRLDRHGGIRRFSWDNEIEFVDGTKMHHARSIVVPKRVAWVRHLTWRRNQADRKIAYSKKHFGFSIFERNPATGEIEYNAQWFNHYEMPVPIRYPDGSVGTPVPVFEVRFVVHSSSSKEELFRSLWSLVRALNQLEQANEVDLRLRVFSEWQNEIMLAEVREYMKLFSIEVEYEIGLPWDAPQGVSADLYLFADSHMLFYQQALLELFLDYRKFLRLAPTEYGMSLVDDGRRYGETQIEPAHLVLGGQRHWRTSVRCGGQGLFLTNTAFRAHSPMLKSLLEKGGERTVVDWQNKLMIFSPIPALVIVLDGGRGEGSPFLDGHMLWESLADMPFTS